jgi:pimeloyl-ACP methyl ester carboxylesterase
MISLRNMLSFFASRPFQVKSVNPPPEPCPARTSLDPAYFKAPMALLDPNNVEGRVVSDLRVAAQASDGNQILQRVAGLVAQNYSNTGSTSPMLITAMTQLAVTGSNAFAAWAANPTKDLTSTLIQLGMPAASAKTASQAIMADFNAAKQAVRNPGAGINESSLRQGLKNGNWIAVSGEDDPPDYPVNVAIAPYPQYHVPITVPHGPHNSFRISIRCIVASAQSVTLAPCSAKFHGPVPAQPQIPPGNEVVLFLHGEGSKAEEALDFIPALFSVGAGVGRFFTVISFDQPSTAYSTMVPDEKVAPPPNDPGILDTSPPSDSPLLDFVYDTIVRFVETFVLPFGNPITAIIGGSLGGHMALRLAASQKDWVTNIIAWSPACVMDHDFSLNFGVGTLTESQSLLADSQTVQRATEVEADGSRGNFFKMAWDQATFDPTLYDAGAVAVAMTLAPGLLTGAFALLAAPFIAGALAGLPKVPAQPLMWFRDDWPGGVPEVPLAPWGPAVSVGPAKAIAIQEARRDRREIYNAISRRWHWRICGEMIRFKFDTLIPNMNKPLLLMVGEADNFPLVKFLDNVKSFAGSLTGLGQCITVQDTGHSIHDERPYFLANQLIGFAPRR